MRRNFRIGIITLGVVLSLLPFVFLLPKFNTKAAITTVQWEESGKFLYDGGWPLDTLGNSDGSFYLAIVDTVNDRALLRKINDEGENVWEDDVIISDAGVPSKLISDGSGGVLILYIQDGVDGYDVYAQRVSSEGIILWEEGGVEVCTAALGQYGVDTVSDGLGGVIVTWRDQRVSGSTGIYVQRISSSGVALWQENGVNIATLDTYYKSYPYIVSDDSGGAIITWTSAVSGSGIYRYIFSQRINSSGVALWNAGGVLVTDMPYFYAFPVSDGDGGVVVAWSNDEGIRLQHLDENGDRLWTDNGKLVVEIADQSPYLESFLTESRGRYNFVRDSEGNYILAWQDARNDEEEWTYDTFAQKVDENGNPLWGISGLPISITPLQEQEGLTISLDSYDGLFLSWLDYREDPELNVGKLYVQYVTKEGEILLTENGLKISDNEIVSSVSSVLGDLKTGAIVTWCERFGEVVDPLYGRKIMILNQIIGLGNNLDVLNEEGDSIKENSLNGANSQSEIVVIRETDTNLLISDVTVDLTSDRDWSIVDGSSDLSLKKAYIENLENAPGVVDTHTLYVPKGANDSSVIICPNATSLSLVNESCPGAIIKTSSSNGTSVVSIEGQSYWKVTGLSGTGGISVLGLTDENQEQKEEEEEIPLVLKDSPFEADEELTEEMEEKDEEDINVIQKGDEPTENDTKEESSQKTSWKYILPILVIVAIVLAVGYKIAKKRSSH